MKTRMRILSPDDRTILRAYTGRLLFLLVICVCIIFTKNLYIHMLINVYN
jgi:hypothetical protein